MKIPKQGAHPDMAETCVDSDHTMMTEAQIAEGMSRRTFLYSLGVLALSACGGMPGQTLASPGRPSAAAARHAAQGRSSSGAFIHPGLLHTQADFARMRQKVAATASPWIEGWNVLVSNDHASLTYQPRPQPMVYRGTDGVHGQNYASMFNDVAAAYVCALCWKVTGNTAYADKAVQIMNAWSSTLTGMGGNSNVVLLAGLQGYEFANAGEIMRGYPGWAAADFTRFQGMMRKVF